MTMTHYLNTIYLAAKRPLRLLLAITLLACLGSPSAFAQQPAAKPDRATDVQKTINVQKTLKPNKTQASTAGVSVSDSVAATADPSAILDVSVLGTTKKGVLIPRVSQSERNAIASPATGLLIYQTDATAGFYFYTGLLWQRLSTGSGLTLPYSDNVAASSAAFYVGNTGGGEGIFGEASATNGVHGKTSAGFGSGVFGENVGGGSGVAGIGSFAGIFGSTETAGGHGGYFRNGAGGNALRTELGSVRFDTLSGSGVRMVVADSLGVLSTQAVSGFALPFSGSVSSTSPALDVNNTGTGSAINGFGRQGVSGGSNQNGGSGVAGTHFGLSGTSVGVRGQSFANSGVGVLGFVNSTTGTTIGVQGASAAPNGYGVYGANTALTGVTHGVYGQSNSPSGYGSLFDNNNGGLALRAQRGGVRLDTLSGSGTRMIVADSSGVLSTQSIPSGGLTLPFSGSDASSTSFLVSNTGTGEAIEGRANGGNQVGTLGSPLAGVFALSSTSNPALQARQFGSGNSVQSTNFGTTGSAGSFFINNTFSTANAIAATTTGSGYGVSGTGDSPTGGGIIGNSSAGTGVFGTGGSFGVTGVGLTGVFGQSSTGNGVYGESNTGNGVSAQTNGSAFNTSAVFGQANSTSGVVNGVFGISSSTSGTGVSGFASATSGATNGGYFSGNSPSGTGVFATGGAFAGRFSGNVQVTGTLSKGGGSFKIDHPQDPANKYLYHSFVESPDMMNIYNGNLTLDSKGEATVELPTYFDALNREFRYQLTCIGGFAQVYIADEIQNNRFKIAGGKAGLKVSWQVTGVRKDVWAEQHRIQVEVDKTGDERGKYLHAKEHGVSETLGINYEEKQRALKQSQSVEVIPPPIPMPARPMTPPVMATPLVPTSK
ncbi:MAG: hypothetical protein IAF08_05300 [Rhizobacter sp.]|nr:hypothetical protein [Chlorobiales bacterium]